MFHFNAGFVVVCGVNNSLDCVAEDNIRDLVARYQSANEGATVDGNDENFFCLQSVYVQPQRARKARTIDVSGKRHCGRASVKDLHCVLPNASPDIRRQQSAKF